MTSAVQVSGKIGDVIFVIGGANAEEFLANATTILGSDAAQMLSAGFGVCLDKNFLDEAEKNVGLAFSSPSAIATSAPGSTPATAGPTDGPKSETDKWGGKWTYGLPNATSCPHGQRVLKEATSQAGKPYKMWCCPTHSPMAYRQKVSKDSNCQGEFLR